MVEVFDDYFQSLFQTIDPLRSFVDCCLDKVPLRVTFEMNVVLLERYSSEEVKHALDQMAPFKSFGPNGFSACFYQSYLHGLGSEVCSIVLSFLN